MKTLVDIDDKLINDIKNLSGLKSKKSIINKALLEYSKELKRKELIKSFGNLKTDFDVMEYRELEINE